MFSSEYFVNSHHFPRQTSFKDLIKGFVIYKDGMSFKLQHSPKTQMTFSGDNSFGRACPPHRALTAVVYVMLACVPYIFDWMSSAFDHHRQSRQGTCLLDYESSVNSHICNIFPVVSSDCQLPTVKLDRVWFVLVVEH